MAKSEINQRTDALRNREAVIEAALELLGEQPGASMQDIAEASEVGRSTVYRHFPTRDELFAELQWVAVKEARIEAEAVFARELSFEETIGELCGVLLQTGKRFRFLLGTEEAVSRERQASRRSTESPIRAYFERCRDAGVIRDDLPLDWMMSAFQALSIVALEDEAAGKQTLAEAQRCFSDSVVAMLEKRS